MSAVNTTEIAVLGLLAQGARTGYDIRRVCEEGLVHFWSESYGQIYPALQALRERGLVERETVTGEGPTRHLHRLTPEGRAALAAWIGEPPRPLRVRNELLLKVFFGRQADPGELARVLADFADRVVEKRAALEALRDRLGDDPDAPADTPWWLLTLDFGLRALEAQQAWVEHAMGALPGIAGVAVDATGGGAGHRAVGAPEGTTEGITESGAEGGA